MFLNIPARNASLNSLWPFVKMHGCGNDFVVLDARSRALTLTPAHIQFIADRRRGIGCDQVIVLEDSPQSGAEFFMRIFNPDASEVGSCGNATRCVAAWVWREKPGRTAVRLQTQAGILDITRAADNIYTANMGPARLDWPDIPLAQACDTLCVPVTYENLPAPVAVNMGNPHAVFFVPDAEAPDLVALGPRIEHDPFFPQRTNVELVSVLAPDRLRMRVWERGAGITPACGSGACAALVAAHRRGITSRRAEIVMDGGTVTIEWRHDNHVLLTGPVATSFTGTLDLPAPVTP